MPKIVSILVLFLVFGCCGINQQRVNDTIEDINENLESMTAETFRQDVDYLKKRLKYLEELEVRKCE